jgi:hypothetical protein
MKERKRRRGRAKEEPHSKKAGSYEWATADG